MLGKRQRNINRDLLEKIMLALRKTTVFKISMRSTPQKVANVAMPKGLQSRTQTPHSKNLSSATITRSLP